MVSMLSMVTVHSLGASLVACMFVILHLAVVNMSMSDMIVRAVQPGQPESKHR